MEKNDVIEFFDRMAPQWDADMIPRDRIINTILDLAGIGKGMDVLDVACGTGVMFPFYLEREVGSVTGVDISPEMARIAGEKYGAYANVRVICADVETAAFDRAFDAVMVYNAFPHFPDAAGLIRALAKLLKENGRLTIAHGMSREQINHHHEGAASKVSMGLMEAVELKEIFSQYFAVDVCISNGEMYQVSGTKKQA